MNDHYSQFIKLKTKINEINNQYVSILKYVNNNRYILSNFNYDNNLVEIETSFDVINIELNNFLYSMENDVRMHNLFNAPHNLDMYKINIDDNNNDGIKSKQNINNIETNNNDKRVFINGNSQLDNSQLDNSQLDNSQLDNSQLDNSQLNNSQLDNSQLDNSQLDNSQLDNSQLDNLYDENVKKIMPYLFMTMLFKDNNSIIKKNI